MSGSTAKAGEEELRHGLHDEGSYAYFHSVTQNLWGQGLDFNERVEIAWSAIVEHLYVCDERPHVRELMQAAWDAIRYESQKYRSAHGISNQDSYSPAWNFFRYWWVRHTTGHEDHIIDRIALMQIWPQLTPGNRRVLTALAVHENNEQAAEALGMKRNTFHSAVAVARREFFRLWHEGEKPSRIWARFQSCDKGTDDHSLMASIVKRRNRRRMKDE